MLNLALGKKWQEETRCENKMRKKCLQAVGKIGTRLRPYIGTRNDQCGNYPNGYQFKL